jgi:phi LC3 family holin
MNKINWRVRFKNPVFWAQIAAAILLPILANLGMNFSDITSWQILFDVLAKGAASPVTVVAVVVAVFNAINDPTTEGLKDSLLARTYSTPHSDK